MSVLVKKIILILFCTTLYSAVAQAQVRCNVALNTQKIQSTNRELFNTMRSAISDFVNTTTWVNHQFEQHEKVECNFIITLNDQSGDEFKGTLQIQSQRPVYGSTYNSPTLNTMDNDFEFSFKENEILEFSENSHLSNLTSMLAYWVYVVLGLDYDTFSVRGGTEWFRKAERIAQNAQSESRPGWSSSSGMNRRNRYWLVENILSAKYARERMTYYRYHRMGLDLMTDKPADARSNILQALREMQMLYREKPDNTMHFYTVFFDTKADEIANIFSEATPKEKEEVYKMLMEINNTNEPKYKKLK